MYIVRKEIYTADGGWEKMEDEKIFGRFPAEVEDMAHSYAANRFEGPVSPTAEEYRHALNDWYGVGQHGRGTLLHGSIVVTSVECDE